MRALVALAAAAIIATPALAQQKPAPPPAPTTQAEMQRALSDPATADKLALSDPATADKLARMMQALSKAILNLPIGEVEADAEGRPVTAADRGKTVLTEGRKDNPNFERDLQAGLANSKPMIESSMKALAASLPAMMQSMATMSKELEKAAENMPRPNYPKR
jgi:hypothetical protein